MKKILSFVLLAVFTVAAATGCSMEQTGNANITASTETPTITAQTDIPKSKVTASPLSFFPVESPADGNDDGYYYFERSVLTKINPETGEVLVSVDGGKTWMSKEEYDENYPDYPDIGFNNIDEWEDWINQQIDDIQNGRWSLMDGYGFPDWEWDLGIDFDEIQERMKSDLEDIQKEIEEMQDQLPDGNGNIYVMTININGESVNLGPYDTKDELVQAVKDYCAEQVAAGKMTQEQADSYNSQADNPFSNDWFEDWFNDDWNIPFNPTKMNII